MMPCFISAQNRFGWLKLMLLSCTFTFFPMLTLDSKEALGAAGTEVAAGRLNSISHLARRRVGAEAEATYIHLIHWKRTLSLQMETKEKM